MSTRENIRLIARAPLADRSNIPDFTLALSNILLICLLCTFADFYFSKSTF